MDCVLKIQELSSGQDKLLRTLQYALRYLLTTYFRYPAVAVLEHQLTLARKITRTSRDLEYFDKGVVALRNPDHIEGVGRAIAAFGKCIWLLTDHIDLLFRIKVIGSGSEQSPAVKWAKISHWLWLMGYLGSVALYFRQLRLLNDKICKVRKDYIVAGSQADESRTVERKRAVLNKLRCELSEVRLQILRELIDCGIPAGGLGLVPPGFSALAGVASSLVGLYQVNLSKK